MKFSPVQRAWFFGVVTFASLAASLVLAVGVAMDANRWGIARGEVADLELRAAAMGAPAAPADARPLVSGPASTLGVRTGEVMNAGLSELGMHVVAVDVTARRAFGDGLQAQFTTLRSRGSMTAGLKTLSWLKANERAIAVQSIAAYPGDGDQADWTINMIVLAAPVEKRP